MNWEDVAELAAASPGVVGRRSWEGDEARRDVELLWWVGRFRFVTAKAAAEWLGVSSQRASVRASRLERLRLLASSQRHVAEARAIYLTTAGAELLCLGRRRTPRLDLQREHEQAIVWACTRIERAASGARVLTERECRRADAKQGPRPYRVEVPISRRNERHRWPDLVLERDGQRTAIEIELSPKTTERLTRIIRGYAGGNYETVRFYVTDAALGRRIQQITQCESDRPSWSRTPTYVVEAWPGLDRQAMATIVAALPTAGTP